MDKQKLMNILNYYYEAASLKEVERTGWQYWNVSRDKRIESIAEHIYGTQQLAMAIFSEFDLKLDIFKVITMLSLHETEEINMGDKTPFDNISEVEKLQLGKVAVAKTLSNLNKKNFYLDLIDEFNSRKTPEAQFAYLCDKLECDLQAKKYSDTKRCSLTSVSPNISNDTRVKEIIAKGAKSVSDVFIAYDENKYAESEIFTALIHYLKNDRNE